MVPDSTGTCHMSIVPGQNGTLLSFFRSRWADHVYRSVSHDQGHSWSPPQQTVLPNNNSSVMALTLASRAIVLCYNESSALDATARRASLYDDIGEEATSAPAPSGQREAFWGAPRAPLTLAVSDDGGITWRHRRNLEVGDGFCLTNNSKDRLNREFSYPSLCQSADGTLHIAYTYWRQAIKYVRVNEAWIRNSQA
jgi:predicted neuraminidase